MSDTPCVDINALLRRIGFDELLQRVRAVRPEITPFTLKLILWILIALGGSVLLVTFLTPLSITGMATALAGQVGSTTLAPLFEAILRILAAAAIPAALVLPHVSTSMNAAEAAATAPVLARNRNPGTNPVNDSTDYDILLKSAVLALYSENNVLKSKIQGLSDHLVDLADEAADLRDENKALTGEVADLTDENQALTDQLLTLTGELFELRGENEALTDQVIQLTGDVANLTSENEALTSEVAILTGEVTQLRSENQTLIGEVSNLSGQVTELGSRVAEVLAFLQTTARAN